MINLIENRERERKTEEKKMMNEFVFSLHFTCLEAIVFLSFFVQVHSN
jgi:hypothetical protein